MDSRRSPRGHAGPIIDHGAPGADLRRPDAAAPRLGQRRALLFTSLVLFAALVLSVTAEMMKGDPIGSEFGVNSYTSDGQLSPVVALNSSGNSVVVWSSWLQDGSGYGVYAQMLDSSGAKIGGEFRVDNGTTDDQMNPAVAMRANGNFIITWQTKRDYQPSSHTYNLGILVKEYDSAGNYLPSLPAWVGDDPDEYDPAVAVSSGSDSTVVIWTSLGRDGSGEGMWGSHSSMGWLPPDITINTYTAGDQGSAAVAMDSDGDFVVVWCSQNQDGDLGGIYGQRFLSDGSFAGSEFQVNSHSSGDQSEPSVAMDSAGNFVVAWSSDGQDGSGRGVYGQRFSATGVAIGSEFRVNTYTSSDQSQPSVAMSSAGEFVVVWSSSGQDGSEEAVVGQRYLSDGTALGSEFMINSHVSGSQTEPCVSMNGMGDFIVVWQSDGQDGSAWGIYGQLYNRAPIPEFPSIVVLTVCTMLLFVALKRGKHL